MITAHNGADHTPENSMEYLLHAMASPADAIEIDVRMNENRMLLFTHDKPADMNMSADPFLQPSFLSLAETFSVLRSGGQLVNCDLKCGNLEKAIFQLAAESGMAERLIFTGSVSLHRIREERLQEKVQIALNIEEYIPSLYDRCIADPGQIIASAREICAICKFHHITCVNAYYRLATDDFMDILQDAGIQLSVWTVNNLPDAVPFFNRNIYNITTRNLRELTAYKM